MNVQLKSIQYVFSILICFLLGALVSPYLGTASYGKGPQLPRRQFTESFDLPASSDVKEVLRNNIVGEGRSGSATPSTGSANNTEGRSNGTAPRPSEERVSKSLIDLDVRTPDLDELYERLVIVTAFSQNHYKEALGVIGTAQREMPGKKIVVYDLGIKKETQKVVQSFCNVELRRFPFENYPTFARNLHVFSWKPIIINTTLNEFGAIFWSDAAVRFQGTLKELLPLAEKHHGYLALIHSFDPKVTSPIRHQYYHTVEGMFEYMGINRTLYYQEDDSSPHATANRQLFLNSTTIQNKLVQPLVECALDEACISPRGARRRKHRYDASALALLLHKNMKYEFTPERNFNKEFDRVIRMERENGENYQPQKCT